MRRASKIYFIEGGIGAGKSTLGAALAETGLASFVPEPVRLWQTKFDENILDLFYGDSKRWAFAFQLAAFTTRAKTYAEIIELADHSTIFLERSIYSDRRVFAESLLEQGLMTVTEFQIYEAMWEWTATRWCVIPDKIIYIRTPAEVCLERIETRARGEETGITLDYLLHLEQKHDDWLLENKSVIIVPGERTVDPYELLTKLGIEEGESEPNR